MLTIERFLARLRFATERLDPQVEARLGRITRDLKDCVARPIFSEGHGHTGKPQ